MKKIVLTIILTICLSFRLNASNYVPCGENEQNTCWNCGSTCSARLTYESEDDALHQRNATLTFSGSGSISNYESPYDNPELIGVEPWWSVRSSITKVVVDEGFTKLGNRTVYHMPNLKEVNLPESLTSIGMRAFFGSSGLDNLVIPNNVTSIGVFAFQSTKIKEIVIPENLTNFAKAFMCEGEEINCSRVPPLEHIYCSQNNIEQCRNAVEHLGITPILYEKTSNGQYFVNGKWYQDLNDLSLGNNIKKRIYTVEEAATLSKQTGNTIKLRYK